MLLRPLVRSCGPQILSQPLARGFVQPGARPDESAETIPRWLLRRARTVSRSLAREKTRDSRSIRTLRSIPPENSQSFAGLGPCEVAPQQVDSVSTAK
jgi:hypothetical protein